MGVYRFEGHISVFNYNEGPSFKEIFQIQMRKKMTVTQQGF